MRSNILLSFILLCTEDVNESINIYYIVQLDVQRQYIANKCDIKENKTQKSTIMTMNL